MANLIPRDSLFQNLFDFRRDFDRIFSRMLTGGPFSEAGGAQAGTFSPAVESYVDNDGKTFHCRVSLPGIDPKDVQIHAHGNSLTITGERKINRTAKDVDVLRNEIYYGAFERTLELPTGVEADKLNAEYRQGVLDVSAPIAASALPRRIEIKTTEPSKQLSASSRS